MRLKSPFTNYWQVCQAISDFDAQYGGGFEKFAQNDFVMRLNPWDD
jgi:hypothetical protein